MSIKPSRTDALLITHRPTCANYWSFVLHFSKLKHECEWHVSHLCLFGFSPFLCFCFWNTSHLINMISHTHISFAWNYFAFTHNHTWSPYLTRATCDCMWWYMKAMFHVWYHENYHINHVKSCNHMWNPVNHMWSVPNSNTLGIHVIKWKMWFFWKGNSDQIDTYTTYHTTQKWWFWSTLSPKQTSHQSSDRRLLTKQ